MAKNARGHGRDVKITPDTVEKICAAIRAGSPLEQAALYAGVPRTTFFTWLQKGRQERPTKVYRDLSEAVDLALAEFEVNALDGINKFGKDEWQALAWMLERKFPDRYGRRTRVDGTMQVSAVPFIDLAKLTTDEANTLLSLLKKAAPAQEQLPADGRPALELVAGGDE